MNTLPYLGPPDAMMALISQIEAVEEYLKTVLEYMPVVDGMVHTYVSWKMWKQAYGTALEQVYSELYMQKGGNFFLCGSEVHVIYKEGMFSWSCVNPDYAPSV